MKKPKYVPINIGGQYWEKVPYETAVAVKTLLECMLLRKRGKK